MIMLPPFVGKERVPLVPFGGALDTISSLFAAGLYICQQLYKNPGYLVIKKNILNSIWTLAQTLQTQQLKIPVWDLHAA